MENKNEPYYTLIVDSGVLFHSMANPMLGYDGKHIGGVYEMLSQMRRLMNRVQFSYVYVFFDNEYSGLLRWQMYEDYKANRGKHYEDYGETGYALAWNYNLKRMKRAIYRKRRVSRGENIPETSIGWKLFSSENFARERAIVCKYFEEMFVRCYMDEIVEADDLIAYYCKHKDPNEKIYIMSGDMDLAQLLADDICIYEMHKKKFITNKNFKDYFGYHPANILTKKVFCGDTSDNIGNIKGLSETAFAKMMPEYIERPVTIEEVKERAQELINERVANKKKPLQVHENIINGVPNKDYDGDFYEINKKIIDLKNPLLTDEAKDMMDSMVHLPIDPEGRSFGNLYKFICTDGLDELRSDNKFTAFFAPFKELADRELDRYKEYVKNNQ